LRWKIRIIIKAPAKAAKTITTSITPAAKAATAADK